MTLHTLPAARLSAACALLIALAPLPAAAAPVSYDFDLTIASGGLAGQTFSGELTYEDTSGVTDGFGDTFYDVGSFSFDFAGQTYTEADIVALTQLLWVVPSGSSAGSLEGSFELFSFVASDGVQDAFFTYDIPGLPSGEGSLLFTAVPTGVPEPASFGLAGLALLGLAATRRRR